ncbi:7383_t:CDS:2, partial [Gigaspora margarita]
LKLSQRIQEEEATYSEIDLPERISEKNDYKELLQKVFNVCNTLFRKIVQTKEKTTRMNTILELERLVLNRTKDFNSKILVEKGLEKDKNPIFESTKDLEISHSL